MNISRKGAQQRQYEYHLAARVSCIPGYISRTSDTCPASPASPASPAIWAASTIVWPMLLRFNVSQPFYLWTSEVAVFFGDSGDPGTLYFLILRRKFGGKTISRFVLHYSFCFLVFYCGKKKDNSITSGLFPHLARKEITARCCLSDCCTAVNTS